MASKKEPKWDIAQAVSSGNKAFELVVKYRADLENRFKPGEIEEFKVSVDELEIRRSGQGENKVDQKEKTKGQDEAAAELHAAIMDTRNMVKASTDNSKYLKAFGVGEDVKANSVSSVRTFANIIIKGYNKYKEWANSEARILDLDIEQIQDLNNGLIGADDVQEKAKIDRKVKTTNKNILQRQVEDMVTMISAIGSRTFRKKSPQVVKLFEDLIP
jgi:hypothetical protein